MCTGAPSARSRPPGHGLLVCSGHDTTRAGTLEPSDGPFVAFLEVSLASSGDSPVTLTLTLARKKTKCAFSLITLRVFGLQTIRLYPSVALRECFHMVYDT